MNFYFDSHFEYACYQKGGMKKILSILLVNQANKLRKNVYHKEKGKAGIWIWKEEEYTSFQEFIVASNSDAQSTYMDPKYKNENKYDFRLKKDSPAMKNME